MREICIYVLFSDVVNTLDCVLSKFRITAELQICKDVNKDSGDTLYVRRTMSVCKCAD
jgi:hypothetical protein